MNSSSLLKIAESPRHSSRLAAVQALYQIEQTQDIYLNVIRSFIDHQFEALVQSGHCLPQEAFFKELVEKTFLLKDELDQKIIPHLADNWRLDRVATVLRLILRLGVYELTYALTTPESVIINEYVEITKDFFPGKNETSFINKILDALSKENRPSLD